MELLRLGHVGLTAAEGGLVATLFRLHGIDQSFIWQLASTPPFDALLIDGQCVDEEFNHLLGNHTRCMRLDQHGRQSDGLMPRPIRSDVLLNWLNSIEVELLHSPGDAFASTAIQSQIDHTSDTLQPSPSKAVDDIALPGVRQIQLQTPPGWEERGDATEYKLRRWPPVALLNKDVARVRVATMISRRPMRLSELADLSRIPVQRCEEFLLEWARHDLVQLSERTQSSMKPASPSDSEESLLGASPKAGFGASLLHSIRRRFGIL